ncbi:MAG: choice-of-anchor J domain-containing protein [Muribaculaceae bacterium]
MGNFKEKTVSVFLFLTATSFVYAALPESISAKGALLKTKIATVRDRSEATDHESAAMARRVTPTVPARVNREDKAANGGILGFRAASDPAGLYSLAADCAETMSWEGEQFWLPTTGFKYGNSIYGISALYMYETMYIDRMDYDISTGEMTYCESIDNNPEHAAITAVYDSSLGEAFAYTYTEDMQGYEFSRLDPEAFEFVKINGNVAIDDVCLAMTYDERKGYVVGITTDARLVRVNETTGIGTTLAILDLNPDTYATAMAYSKDSGCYLYQMIDEDGVASIVAIDADNYTIVSKNDWPEGEIRQYTVMFAAGDAFEGTSPSSPHIASVTFAGPASSGTVSVVAPDKYVDGSAITAAMTIELATEDGTTQTKNNVQPGAEVVFNVNDLGEGNHIFGARAVIGATSGPWSKTKKYVGYDEPKAPTNVRIEGSNALWDSVTEGASGGYVDASGVTYEVSLNGTFVGTTDATTMALTLPEMFTENQVSVIAVYNGKKSLAGVSERVAAGLIALGETLEPSESEWSCFGVSDADNDGVTWDYSYYFGAYYSADEGDAADDWLVLPAYKINDNGKRHILSYHVDVEGDRDAHIKVYEGSTPDVSSMRAIGDYTYVNGENDGSQEYYLLPAGNGKCYIAFEVLTSCSVYLESMTLSETDALATAADNVTDLTAAADSEGALKAEVAFTLPVKAIDGSDLSGMVEVLVKSEVEEQTLTGNPGERKTTSITVPEGLSRILVKTKNGSDCYTEQIFAGVDMPSVVNNITDEVSDDNMTVTLRWEKPTRGVYNGYIDPTTLYYSISVYDPEEGWVEIAGDLTATEYAYTMPAGSKYEAYDFMIAAGNSAGLSDDVATHTVAMGELYDLPLKDYMEDGGTVGPLLQIGGDEYQASWTTAYPEWYDEAASEIEDYVAICVNYYDKPTKGSLIFPKFKPLGGEKIMTAFKFFFGEKTPDFKLYVLSPGGNKTLLAAVKASDVVPGYQTIRNLVADDLKESAWLQIMLEVDFDNSEQSLIFPYYAITAAYDQDLALTGVSGPATLLLGETGTYSVAMENVGYEDIDVAMITFNAMSGTHAIANGTIVSAPSAPTLHPGDVCAFECNISIDEPTYLGTVALRAAIDGEDKDSGNNEKQSHLTLSNDCKPVVTNLAAKAAAEGVALSWSAPEIGDITEGFESYVSFESVDMLGDFINIDNDGAYTYGYCFPYHAQGIQPTGWVVWDRASVEQAEYNNYYLPASGDRAAVAIAPCYYEDADDWLISPQVKGGTQVTFKMAGGTDYSVETVEVMASTTDRDIDSFESVEMVSVYDMTWTDQTVELPADAKYFALRYCSSSRGCLVMIDDLEFTPATADAVITGYDIVRNGATIQENVASDCAYTDAAGEGKTLYRVCPVYTLNGETMRGYLSNVASVATSGVDGVIVGKCRVYGEKGQIVILGAAGQTARIYSIDGKIISNMNITNERESVSVPTGVYLTQIGERTVKVFVI